VIKYETETEKALAARVSSLETRLTFVLSVLDAWNDDRPGDLNTPDKQDFRRRMREAEDG
jgi:hypothetical protein